MEPIDIRHVADEEFLISWEDGHRSLYAYDYLRLHCPCAGCVDEWSGKRTIQPEQIKPGIKLRETVPVGRYAFRFRWSDGHQTGLYSFNYLRQICPCAACQPDIAGEAH